MRYLGGKSRIAKQLAARIRELSPDAKGYWDPFCGGLSMSVALSEYAPVVASDACAPLIALYQAIRDGWAPPERVDRDTWLVWRDSADKPHLQAFARFGCTFGGNWSSGFAGETYADSKRAHIAYAASTRNVLLRDVPRVRRFECIDFLALTPDDVDLDGFDLYLDPPYAGRTGYPGAPDFDHDLFYKRVVEWSAYATVFVSEYDFPVGSVVWERDRKGLMGLDSATRTNTERLYHLPKGSRW